jgi:hypothetical protein
MAEDLKQPQFKHVGVVSLFACHYGIKNPAEDIT